ncbi:glycerate kinase type-2 family protein (plasmid) [Aureimonas ureilytica]|uniref:glycerate kinase type-2 family protein n=1 Tax=Aureimonas ureilytica TaxID=401562 RepID=UPI003CFAF004
MSQYDALRARALDLFRAGVGAADPSHSVMRSLREAPLPAAGPGGRVSVVAFGKAAPLMAKAALSVIDADEVLVVTVDGLAVDLPGADVHFASHPVPDERGEAAAREVLRRAEALGPQDRLLALVSGGASALLPAPVEGVSLADKIAVNRLLLASGAEIGETNLVRQSLSRLKGGGLARAAAPAGILSLILSDVVEGDLGIVASGPTAAPLGSQADAAALLRRFGLWETVPDTVRRHLERVHPPRALPPVDNRLIGSNALSVAAMARACAGAKHVAEPLVGDVSDAAETVLAHWPEPGGAVLFGGETTVRIAGDGLGGRNQELSLRVAMLARARGLPGDFVFLSGGTDGRDGPTDAAGGLVDGATLSRMREAGVDPTDALARNDSYHALKASGDLILMPPTGTNVADLQVLMRL